MSICALALLLLAGCGSDSGPSDKDVLVSLTDRVIVPAYQDVARDAAGFNGSVMALCSAPSHGTLQAARASWLKARASWMRSEAMWFGPVMDRRSTRLLDWSPTDVAGIDEALAAGAAPTAEQAREVLASDRRGFGAMEHILFGSDELADPTNGKIACAYLTSLSAVVQEETVGILDDWVEGEEGSGGYAGYFSDRTEVSVLPSAAIADVVRIQYFLIRDMVDMRLAGAMGLRQDPPDPTLVPGNAADNGLQDIRNELAGMRAIYEGVGEDGVGLGGLVSQLSEETDAKLKRQFDAAIAAADSVSGSFHYALAQRSPPAQALYERLADVQQTIGTEVVSLLGVSIGFTDTDGDSLR